ncbi:MAG: gamma-glutamylcyclotransferase [Rickettsiales bacterium]|nr:gamma-glutamylcyclotransferase [Rickettsiales bacterium]
MKIFAYGTLKKGGVLHKHMEGARYIKKRKIHGYVLYLAPDETYPLLYHTGDKKDVVIGELWQINEKIKRKLDTYEEGYVLKKLLKSPILTYYPNYDIKHLSRLIPKNKHGKYEFNVKEEYYAGFNITGVIAGKDTDEKPKKKAVAKSEKTPKKSEKPKAKDKKKSPKGEKPAGKKAREKAERKAEQDILRIVSASR